MSFQAMSMAISVPLPAARKSLLICLSNYANDKLELWPSLTTLSEDAGLSRRSVINYLKEFEESGLLVSESRTRGDGSQTSNLYRLTFSSWFELNGYEMKFNERGFFVEKIAQAAPPSAGDAPPPVQDVHPPSAPDAPHEPVIRTCHLKPIVPDKPEKPRRKCRIPENFQLTANMANKAGSYWQSKGRGDLGALEQFDAFKAHHTATGSMMLNWEAAWQTWYTKAISFNRPAYKTAHDQRVERANEIHDYDEARNF